MTTNYDPIAEQYQRSKQQPWRAHIEAFTLLQLVGDVTDQTVLDVACGEGFYSRLLRQQGAASVTGVDLSSGMIELARRQETLHRQGIEYLVGDARDLQRPQPVDLVVSAYLLNYSRNRNELQTMYAGIAQCLRPGGRFVTVNCNPSLSFPHAPCYRKYGFETTVLGDWQEGAPIQWKFYLCDDTFEIENYHLDVMAHEEAIQRAGLRDVRWHSPQLAADGVASQEPAFWASFMEHPPVAFIECIK